MATRYLIMLAADARAVFGDEDADPTAVTRRRLRRFRHLLLRLGDPIIEQSGVVSRRVLWAHDFPAAWPDGVRQVEFDIDGTIETVPMNLTPTFPANWRYPLTP